MKLELEIQNFQCLRVIIKQRSKKMLNIRK